MRKRKEGGKHNVPIEDETGHANWSSRISSNGSSDGSSDLSDKEESEDDRRTTGRSMRRSRTQAFDEQKPRRLRVRDWDADSPPQARSSIRWRSNSYGRPRRRSLHALQYEPAAFPMNSPYARTPPPDRRIYRSRSLTPPTRRGYHSSPSRQKRETFKEAIKPLAAGAAGLIAGGFLGHAAGKGDMMATVAGAVFGAVGGSEFEKEWQRHKERKKKNKGKMRD